MKPEKDRQDSPDSKDSGNQSNPVNPPFRPPFPVAEFEAAVAKEREIRDYAFFDLPQSIAGVDICQMTLRQMQIRIAIDCPFFHGRVPEPAEIASFLWYLSPNFSTDKDARAAFMASIAHIAYPEAVLGINDYLDATFLDAPPSSGGTRRIPRTSIAATLIDIFAKEYGWTRNEILDSPIVQLYQLVREIQQRNNPKVILFNRLSDRVRNDYAKSLNKPSPELSTHNSQPSTSPEARK